MSGAVIHESESGAAVVVPRSGIPLSALIAFVMIGAIVAAAVAAPWFSPFDPNEPQYDRIREGPGVRHWLGTDNLGRDQFSRILAGARISLQIAFVASLLSLVVGVTWGAVAGYAGGLTDQTMMRVVDILYGIPTLIVVILLMVWLERGVASIYIAIGLTYWLNMARLTRAQVLVLRRMEFTAAALALGAGPVRILTRHILPNAAGVILVTLTLMIPEAIFLEAFLSYIGLGVPDPDASWGTLASDGTASLRAAPYLLFFPAAAICGTILAFNVAGDYLRDRVAGAVR